MNWSDRVPKKGEGPSSKGPSGGGIKVVEAENDFPIPNPNYIRIGSAHAVERSGNREALADLLGRFCEEFNSMPLSSNDTNTIRIEEK
jgi:hypothetical protein